MKGSGMSEREWNAVERKNEYVRKFTIAMRMNRKLEEKILTEEIWKKRILLMLCRIYGGDSKTLLIRHREMMKVNINRDILELIHDEKGEVTIIRDKGQLK